MPATLFAWVGPVATQSLPPSKRPPNGFALLDHTWVTSYDNRTVFHAHANIAAVTNASVDYWYCWGDFHPQGGTRAFPDGLIRGGAANLALARCLVTENQDSRLNLGARGTVLTYPRDGVCYQLANQVLYAASPNLTVAGVRLYGLSIGRYGTYGRNDAQFFSKFAACVGSSSSQSARAAMDDRPEGPAARDEFGTRLQELVGRWDPERAERILALRAHLQRADDEAPENESQAESDRRLNFFLTEARRILDNGEIFRQLFDAEPGQMVSFASAAE